jgi:hypothetical protein
MEHNNLAFAEAEVAYRREMIMADSSPRHRASRSLIERMRTRSRRAPQVFGAPHHACSID